jgi:hypothetical protein
MQMMEGAHMVVSMQDEFRADSPDHVLELAGIGEIAAWFRSAYMRRVMDEHDAEAGGIATQLSEDRFRSPALFRPDAAARHEGKRRNGGGEPDYRDGAVAAQERKYRHGAVVASSPRGDFLEQALERAAHIGVVIARHEGDLGRVAETLEEHP